MYKIIIVLIINLVFTFHVNAEVTCRGKIIKVHKWNTADRISILMDTASNWIQMSTATDDAMALMAFAADKTIELRWTVPEITSCTTGWAQHRPLEGWWWVLKN